MMSPIPKSEVVIDLSHDNDEEDRKLPAFERAPSPSSQKVPSNKKITLAQRLHHQEQHDSLDDGDCIVVGISHPRKCRSRVNGSFCTTSSNKRSRHDSYHANDLKLAAFLQQEEEEFAAMAKREEAGEMLLTPIGKAYSFVEQVLASVPTKKKIQSNSSADVAAYAASSVAQRSREGSYSNEIMLSTVTKDDMFFMAKNLLILQEQYAKLGIDNNVDIGFHYTSAECIDKIKKYGLLTAQERTAHELGITPHGANFGTGVYTGNNPFAFRQYGNVGE